jgi:membrane-associated phospholipid phosphatase
MLTVMMPLFSGIKGAIPLFNAYSWDQTFIDLDRSIHGTDAWLLLQPVLGYPIVTSILSQLYHLWILLIYLGGVWFAIYCPDTAIRRRFFFAYILMWSIGGVAMAIGFASVGPCFTERMLGIDTFTAQMDYLRTANQSYPVTVLVVQDELLRLYNAGDYGLGRGITAMPSMHVGLACLFWLAMRQIDRRLGWAFFAFFLIIMLGSVHLGYHYAVDGYASIALVAGLWWLGGKLIGPGAPMPVVKP